MVLILRISVQLGLQTYKPKFQYKMISTSVDQNTEHHGSTKRKAPNEVITEWMYFLFGDVLQPFTITNS